MFAVIGFKAVLSVSVGFSSDNVKFEASAFGFVAVDFVAVESCKTGLVDVASLPLLDISPEKVASSADDFKA